MIKNLLKFSLILYFMSASKLLGSDSSLRYSFFNSDCIPSKDSFCTSYLLSVDQKHITDVIDKVGIVDNLADIRRQKFINSGNYESAEKIIHPSNGDRRQPLKDSVYSDDYNFNCYLEIYYANVNGTSKIYHGSGTLVAPNIVLTAGHNLYGLSDGGYPDRIDCFIACYRNNALNVGTVFPNLDFKNLKPSIFVHSRYLEDEAIHYRLRSQSSSDQENYIFSPGDIGLIIFKNKLSTNFAVPTVVADIIKQDPEKSKKLIQKRFTITGYPGFERHAYTMTDKIIDFDCNQNKIWYDFDTQPGQSGSGICTHEKYQSYHRCVGIHTCAGAEGKNYNIGTLIDAEIVKKIDECAMYFQ